MGKLAGLLGMIGAGIFLFALPGCSLFSPPQQAPPVIINNTGGGTDSGIIVLLTFAGIGAIVLAIGGMYLLMRWQQEKMRRQVAEAALENHRIANNQATMLNGQPYTQSSLGNSNKKYQTYEQYLATREKVPMIEE